MSASVLLVAENVHVDSCGTPPSWALAASRGSARYYGENSLGEQMVAVASYDGVRIAGGDLGWENEQFIERVKCLQAIDGGLTQKVVRTTTGWVLNTEEWLLIAAAFACCSRLCSPDVVEAAGKR